MSSESCVFRPIYAAFHPICFAEFAWTWCIASTKGNGLFAVCAAQEE
jgi:hypothetical protein